MIVKNHRLNIIKCNYIHNYIHDFSKMSHSRQTIYTALQKAIDLLSEKTDEDSLKLSVILTDWLTSQSNLVMPDTYHRPPELTFLGIKIPEYLFRIISGQKLQKGYKSRGKDKMSGKKSRSTMTLIESIFIILEKTGFTCEKLNGEPDFRKKLDFKNPQNLHLHLQVEILQRIVTTLKSILGNPVIKGYMKTSERNSTHTVKVRAVDESEKKLKQFDPNDEIKTVQVYTDKRAPAPERSTCNAVFELPFGTLRKQWTEQRKVYSWLIHEGLYTAILKIYSILEGRLRFWYDCAISNVGIRIGKSGFAFTMSPDMKEDDDLLTHIFCTLCKAEFDTRAPFTSAPHKRRTLNPHLDSILEMLKISATTDWAKIALLIPYEDILERCSPEQIQKLEEQANAYIPVFGHFLDKEFDKKRGVSTRLLKSMVVDHKREQNRYPINSTAWNNAANGFTFIVRLLNTISHARGELHSGYLPVSFLTAHDQFRWMGKRVKPFALIWCFMASMNRPWKKMPFDELQSLFDISFDAVVQQEDPSNQDMDIETLYRLVENRKIMSESFFGIMKKKVTDIKIHEDMICGCSVDGVSKDMYDFLRKIGIFGSTPWTGSSLNDEHSSDQLVLIDYL